MGGGHFKNVPELVETLVNQAPDVIRWLEGLGCNFTKFPDAKMQTHPRRRHLSQAHALCRRHHRRRDDAHRA